MHTADWLSGRLTLPSRCMIFVHYDADGGLSSSAMKLLTWYRQHVARLVVVSNSPIEVSDRGHLLEVATDLIIRENEGYDFGAWRDAISALGPLDAYDELCLANDSVLGPLFPADSLFDRVSALPNDVCGLVASWEYGWHIQSWFVCYKRRAFTSEAFKSFWRGIEARDSKAGLIESYEVGLTRALSDAGLSLGALFAARKSPGSLARLAVAARNMSPAEPDRSIELARRLRHLPELNPMHFQWDEVLAAGIPMVKRELLGNNPNRIDLKGIFRRFPELGNSWVDPAK